MLPCKHLFCNQCLLQGRPTFRSTTHDGEELPETQSQRNCCPLESCQREFSIAECKGLEESNPDVWGFLADVDIACVAYRAQGCEWQGTYGAILEHLERDCQFAPRPCEFKDVGCEVVQRRADLINHLRDEVHKHLAMTREALQSVRAQLTVAEQRTVTAEEKAAAAEQRLVEAAAAAAEQQRRLNSLPRTASVATSQPQASVTLGEASSTVAAVETLAAASAPTAPDTAAAASPAHPGVPRRNVSYGAIAVVATMPAAAAPAVPVPTPDTAPVPTPEAAAAPADVSTVSASSVAAVEVPTPPPVSSDTALASASISDSKAGEAAGGAAATSSTADAKTIDLNSIIPRCYARTPVGAYPAFSSERLELKFSLDHEGPAWDVAEMPGGRCATSGAGDKLIRVWDLSHSTLLRTAGSDSSQRHSRDVGALVCIGPERLMSGADDSLIKVWDTTNGECVTTIDQHAGSVYALTVLPNGMVASGSQDSKIMLWDVATERRLRTFTAHTAGVNSLVTLSDGCFVSLSQDRTARIWDSRANDSDVITGFELHNTLHNLAALPDGRFMTGSNPDKVQVWDRRSLKQSLLTMENAGYSMTALPDGRIATCNYDGGSVNIWDLDERKCVSTLTSHTRGILVLRTMSDGTLVTGCLDDTAKVWRSRPIDRSPSSDR